MSPGADVQDLEVLKDWFAALTQFRTDVLNGVTSVSLALQRAGEWLLEQQQLWRRQIRQAEDEVVQARTDLRNRQYEEKAGHHPDTTVQEENVRKALARLEFCHERLEATRRWQVKLPTVIQDVYEGPGRRLRYFLEAELPRALGLLDRQIGSLEQYLGLQAPVTRAASAAPNTSAPTKETP
jgi:hypothetical protein